MKIIISSIFLLSLNGIIHAQNSPLFSQYMFNNFLINPACAGAEGYTSFDLTARENWLKIPNAPRTYALTFQTRLVPNKGARSPRKRYQSKASGKVGLGGSVYRDNLGDFSSTGLSLTYAYHLYIQKVQVSMGVSLIGYQYLLDKTNVKTVDSDIDPLLQNPKAYVPDANVGISAMYMGGYVGLSASNLASGSINFANKNTVDLNRYRSYNLLGYYLFDLQNDFAIEPGMWLKMQEKTGGKSMMLNTRIYYAEEYWLGLGYRSTDKIDKLANAKALIFMAGVRYDRLFFGYSYDYNMEKLSSQSFGSHEFMFAAKFGENVRRYRWVSRY